MCLFFGVSSKKGFKGTINMGIGWDRDGWLDDPKIWVELFAAKKAFDLARSGCLSTYKHVLGRS